MRVLKVCYHKIRKGNKWINPLMAMGITLTELAINGTVTSVTDKIKQLKTIETLRKYVMPMMK